MDETGIREQKRLKKEMLKRFLYERLKSRFSLLMTQTLGAQMRTLRTQLHRPCNYSFLDLQQIQRW